MDELIIGKDYYVSDASLEVAKRYKREKNSDILVIYKGDEQFFHVETGDWDTWDYWVRADEEITPEQLEASMQKLIEPLVTCLQTVATTIAKWAESEEGKAILEKINKENHPWT